MSFRSIKLQTPIKSVISTSATINLYFDKAGVAADKATACFISNFPNATDCRDQITVGKGLRDVWNFRRSK